MHTQLSGFRASLARAPEAPAVLHAGQALSYRELDRRSDGLAAALLARGVAPETPVGILLGRCPAFVVAMLAVDKAGGACLPLDPTLPEARLSAILAAAAPALVITDTVNALPDGTQVLPTDALAQCWDAGGVVAPHADDPDRLAILSFTSGSTGRPKGVALTAGNIAAGAQSWRGDLPDAGARTLLYAPPGFITGNIELCIALGEGGALVVVDEAVRREPAALLDFLAEQAITRAFIPATPTLAMAEVANVASLAKGRPRALAMRHWMMGAEPLRVSPAMRAFVRALPDTRFFNTHGSTEAGPVARLALPQDPDAWPATPPIGASWPGVQWALLDADDRPVAPGDTGELVVAGAAVARGYWQLPTLTEARFPDPPPAGLTGRAYRTGDLVRQTPDGALHWVGRADDQIKIGGNRLEPAEVEAVLLEHGALADAAIAAQPDASGALRLVAFIVPRPGVDLPAHAELAAHLAARVPPYMVPALWAELPALPRLQRGKLDRHALPLVASAPQVAAGRPPAGPEEELVARLMGKLLGLVDVGADDDFFLIGGDSVRALQLVGEAHRHGVKLTLRDVFERCTVAALASRIAGQGASGAAGAHLLPLTAGAGRPDAQGPALIFIHAVGGMVFNYVPLALRLPEYRCFGLQARGMEPGEEPDRDFDAMLESYAHAVRQLLPEGPYILFGYSFGGVIAHELLRRLRPQPRAEDLLILVDAVNPARPGPPPPRNLDDVLMSGLDPLFPALARMVRPFLGLLPARAKLALGRRAIRQFLATEPEALAFQDISMELVERIMRVWLAGAAMHETARCTPHAARAVLLRARERLDPPETDQVQGWEALVASLAIHELPGNHFSMLAPEHVPEVVRVLRAVLGLPP